MSGWSWYWLAWVLIGFGIPEGVAIFRNQTVGPGNRLRTLSQNVWKLFKIKDEEGWHWRRALLAIGMVWLLVHMVAGF